MRALDFSTFPPALEDLALNLIEPPPPDGNVNYYMARYGNPSQDEKYIVSLDAASAALGRLQRLSITDAGNAKSGLSSSLPHEIPAKAKGMIK